MYTTTTTTAATTAATTTTYINNNNNNNNIERTNGNNNYGTYMAPNQKWTQFKARSLAVIRRYSLSTQTIACQQSTHGRGQTKTKREREREKICFKARFERGQGGCLTGRQSEFVPGKRTKEGEPIVERVFFPFGA